jgi:hypothetical protein
MCHPNEPLSALPKKRLPPSYDIHKHADSLEISPIEFHHLVTNLAPAQCKYRRTYRNLKPAYLGKPAIASGDLALPDQLTRENGGEHPRHLAYCAPAVLDSWLIGNSPSQEDKTSGLKHGVPECGDEKSESGEALLCHRGIARSKKPRPCPHIRSLTGEAAWPAQQDRKQQPSGRFLLRFRRPSHSIPPPPPSRPRRFGDPRRPYP